MKVFVIILTYQYGTINIVSSPSHMESWDDAQDKQNFQTNKIFCTKKFRMENRAILCSSTFNGKIPKPPHKPWIEREAKKKQKGG